MADPSVVTLAIRRPSYQRRFTRHEVHLAVRFESAAQFVTEYAENLSHGGLFVAGGHELEHGSEIDVELDLPGGGSYRMRATVCHILTPEVAAQVGRSPGAGLELVNPPKDFEEDMHGYLMRLGRRREYLVMADSDDGCEFFETAGYRAALVPRPLELVAAVARATTEVVAVVAHRKISDTYKSVADAAGADDLVLHYDVGVRDLLPLIDDRI